MGTFLDLTGSGKLDVKHVVFSFAIPKRTKECLNANNNNAVAMAA